MIETDTHYIPERFEDKLQDSKEDSMEKEENALLEWEKKYLEDLKRMKKQEEKQSDGRLSNGRRKWFNREIKQVKDRIEGENQ